MERPSENAPATASAEGYARIAKSPEFLTLVRQRRRFVVPATIFFVAYYFALPLLVGYAPEFMGRPVIGPVNLAYLFALSQFFMAWAVAALYVRAASRFDKTAAHILATVGVKRIAASSPPTDASALPQEKGI